MALDSNIVGALSGTGADVTASRQLKVILPDGSTPADVGGVRMFSENDAGTKTGVPYLYSPETDEDYRLRVSQEFLYDTETFNYTAQNTGKHTYAQTTMNNSWLASGLTTNSANITNTTTATSVGTYAEFPLFGASILYSQFLASFSTQPVSNTIVDFGLYRRGAANPYAPTDGAYFRLTSAGLFGVINSNGSEVTTSVFDFTYTNNQVYQFIISIHERETQFWINDILYAAIPTPDALGQPFMSASLPVSMRHAIVGGSAGGALNFILRDYTVSTGGPSLASTAIVAGQRMLGSYQGLSGGTMGSLATYVNSTNPTAAAPSNTALTANLPGGLGGQGAVTAAVAAATDGIWGSYQVPAGTANVQGRRLVLRGISLHLVNLGAAVATTATTIQFSLAFGHTSVSLATAEAVAAKAPRRLSIGIATWPIGAAIGATPTNGPILLDLGDAPIYVNPGEFLQLVGKFLAGTATASQVINFTWQPIYGWE